LAFASSEAISRLAESVSQRIPVRKQVVVAEKPVLSGDGPRRALL
jgi:hypothetical protein